MLGLARGIRPARHRLSGAAGAGAHLVSVFVSRATAAERAASDASARYDRSPAGAARAGGLRREARRADRLLAGRVLCSNTWRATPSATARSRGLERRTDRPAGLAARLCGIVWRHAGVSRLLRHRLHIPLARVHESRDVFTRMGAAVTERIYPGMGHTVNADEIAHVSRLLTNLATSPAASR